jgi:hypothetical protein
MLPAAHTTTRGSLTVNTGALEVTLGPLRRFRNVRLRTFLTGRLVQQAIMNLVTLQQFIGLVSTYSRVMGLCVS